MSDERIVEAIAESLYGDPVQARGILGDLREAGFDVYRPDECALLDYWQDTPDDKVALVDLYLSGRITEAQWRKRQQGCDHENINDTGRPPHWSAFCPDCGRYRTANGTWIG